MDLLQGFFKVVWFETERARLALVGNSVVLIDEIDSIGPAGVGSFGFIIEFIDHSRELDSQLAHAGSCYVGALVEILRTREDNLIPEIALRLPDVAGVRLDDVDDQERNSITVLIVELVESGNLPPEGRSGIAAENQHHGLLCSEG